MKTEGGNRHEPKGRTQNHETEGDGAAEGGKRRGPECDVHGHLIGSRGLAGAEPELVIFPVVRRG